MSNRGSLRAQHSTARVLVVARAPGLRAPMLPVRPEAALRTRPAVLPPPHAGQPGGGWPRQPQHAATSGPGWAIWASEDVEKRRARGLPSLAPPPAWGEPRRRGQFPTAGQRRRAHLNHPPILSVVACPPAPSTAVPCSPPPPPPCLRTPSSTSSSSMSRRPTRPTRSRPSSTGPRSGSSRRSVLARRSLPAFAWPSSGPCRSLGGTARRVFGGPRQCVMGGRQHAPSRIALWTQAGVSP